MSRGRKVVAVVAVYAALALLAWIGSVVLRIGSPPIDEASSGMSAFGDMVLFLGVLAVGAVPATVAAVRIWKRPAGADGQR